MYIHTFFLEELWILTLPEWKLLTEMCSSTRRPDQARCVVEYCYFIEKKNCKNRNYFYCQLVENSAEQWRIVRTYSGRSRCFMCFLAREEGLGPYVLARCQNVKIWPSCRARSPKKLVGSLLFYLREANMIVYSANGRWNRKKFSRRQWHYIYCTVNKLEVSFVSCESGIPHRSNNH